VAAGYAVLAGLWILFSDAAAAALITDPRLLHLVSTAKGWAFVAVTGSILYWLVRRYLREIEIGESALRGSERRLERIVATIPSAVLIVGRDGRITMANSAAVRILRLPAAEIVTRTFDDPAWRGETLDGRPLRSDEYPSSRVFATGESVYDVRFAIVHPDGSRAVLSANASPLLDEKGEIIAVVSATADITEEYAAEQKLVHVNRLYSMLSQINEAIVRIRDERGLFAEACRITVEYGRFRMAWVGLVDRETGLLRPMAYAGEEREYLDVVRITVNDEDEGHGPEGTAGRLGRTVVSNDIEHDPYMRPWSAPARERGYRALAAFPLRLDDAVVGVFAIYASEKGFFDAEEIRLLEDLAEDIAFGVAHIRQEQERRRAEEELFRHREHLEELVEERTVELRELNERLRQATEAKSRFLAHMSHELRTPLNSVIGFTAMMLKGMAGELNPEQEKQLGMVDRAGKQLLRLVNDVLEISKIEAGRMSVEPGDVTLAELVDDVAATIRPLADEKDLALHVAVGDGETVLHTDRGKLGEVLVNVLANAVKFTERGDVELDARAEEPDVVFTVTDTGIGIAPEDQERIFDEFEQAKRPGGAGRSVRGTGLGLAISKRLTELLGGTLRVESEPGRGSVFVLRVPRVIEDEDTKEGTEE
jgi:PAS domain S-box-containing protein